MWGLKICSLPFILISCFFIKANCQSHSLNIDTGRIAILDLGRDKWLQRKFENVKPDQLNSRDVNSIDSIFSKCLADNHIDTGYYKYKRQYVAFVDKDKHKKIWINCFCNDEGDFKYWKKQPVLVEDGGDCFFNFMIDLNDKQYYRFEVNGIG